jgi:hypothetical protein
LLLLFSFLSCLCACTLTTLIQLCSCPTSGCYTTVRQLNEIKRNATHKHNEASYRINAEQLFLSYYLCAGTTSTHNLRKERKSSEKTTVSKHTTCNALVLPKVVCSEGGDEELEKTTDKCIEPVDDYFSPRKTCLSRPLMKVWLFMRKDPMSVLSIGSFHYLQISSSRDNSMKETETVF